MIWKAAQIQDATTGPVSVAEWFYTNESKTCPVPLDPLMATPLRDLACYFGPGMGYPKAGGFLLRGEWAEVHGQSLLGDWLALADLDGFTSCWLPLEAVETTGDPSELRKSSTHRSSSRRRGNPARQFAPRSSPKRNARRLGEFGTSLQQGGQTTASVINRG